MLTYSVLTKTSRKTRYSFGVLQLQKMIHQNESSDLIGVCPFGAQEAAIGPCTETSGLAACTAVPVRSNGF